MFKTEVCCGSYPDVLAARQGGAQRVELCSCLFFGGLTPSLGTFLLAKSQCDIEIAVMLRPRAGGFCYSPAEFAVLYQDAEIFVKNGANALVFGCLNADGTLCMPQIKALCALAKGSCQTVFHKAFDVAKVPMEVALEQLISAGVSRVLTSGGHKSAIAGAKEIKQLLLAADGRIEILPGGGIRAHNIGRLRELTGCTQAHTSAFVPCRDDTARHDEVLFTDTVLPPQGEYPRIDSRIIHDFVTTVREL